jgi:hypothetical protein
MFKISTEMIRNVSIRREFLPHWQALLCLVLIGLMLYNPFVGLWGSNDGLCYDHLARNRATVGASELQHFSPVTNSTNSQTELDIDVPAIGLLQIVTEEVSREDLQEVILPQIEFCTSLWNRPPPSL